MQCHQGWGDRDLQIELLAQNLRRFGPLPEELLEAVERAGEVPMGFGNGHAVKRVLSRRQPVIARLRMMPGAGQVTRHDFGLVLHVKPEV